MGPNTVNGLEGRLAKDPIDSPYRSPQYDDTAWQTWKDAPVDTETGLKPFTWRIMILPIVEDVYTGGHHTLSVTGMAGFFISKVYDKQDERDDPTHLEGDVEGYFIQGIKVGEDVRWIFATSGSTSDTPRLIRAVRLIS